VVDVVDVVDVTDVTDVVDVTDDEKDEKDERRKPTTSCESPGRVKNWKRDDDDSLNTLLL